MSDHEHDYEQEHEHEWVSAYLDDELTPAERARGSRTLGRQPQARRRLGRYLLIGDAMRDNLPERLYPGFARRVHQKIVEEADSPARHHTLQELWHWIRHPAPLAVGSGLTAMLVAAGLWFYEKQPAVVPVAVEAPAGPVAEAPASEPDAQARQQILGYLAAHAEVEPWALMPHAELVDYER